MSAPALDPDLEAPVTTAVIGTDPETPAAPETPDEPQTPHQLGDALAAQITDEPTSLLAAKLVLQRMIVRVEKRQRGENERGEYAYADLATDVHEVLMPVLTRLGLLWETLPMVLDSGAFVLQYSLTHVASNEWQGGNWPLGSPAATAQAKGSDVTYGRRYALLACLGIAPRNQDDDGKKQRDEQRGQGGGQRSNGQQNGGRSNGGGQQRSNGRGPGGGAGQRINDAIKYATAILSATDTEKADRWCAWVDNNGWERDRVRVQDADRKRLELGDQAPTLRDIAQAQSAYLHDRDERAARAGAEQAAQRDDAPIGDPAPAPSQRQHDEDRGGDPWANAPLMGSDAARAADPDTAGETSSSTELCGAPTIGGTPCQGSYDPARGHCSGLDEHDLNADWDDEPTDADGY